jgi:hypothetical protein
MSNTANPIPYDEVWQMYLKASKDLHDSLLRERKMAKQIAALSTLSQEEGRVQLSIPTADKSGVTKYDDNQVKSGRFIKGLKEKNKSINNQLQMEREINEHLTEKIAVLQGDNGISAYDETELAVLKMIAVERLGQFNREGWTLEHDQQHKHGELAIAAACYALHDTDARVENPNSDNENGWPWESAWWKPKEELMNLVRSAALIIAEIRRKFGDTIPPSTPR